MTRHSAARSRSSRIAHRALAVLAAVGIVGSLVLVAGSAQASVPTTQNVVKPRISGVPVVGNVLSASTGGWLGAPPLFYHFQWRDSRSSDLGETRDYTPVAADVGLVLTVRVTVQDGNNIAAHVDVSTRVPVAASDVVSTSPPRFTGGLAVGDTVRVSQGAFTSGSGALSYSYAWSATDGQTVTPLADTGATHLITSSDLGLYLSVIVTATSPSEFGTVTARTPHVVAPAIPFATDAALTSSNRGTVTVATSGTSATIADPTGVPGAGIFVYGYSHPAALGWFALSAKDTITVGFDSLSVGAHKLVVMDQTGAVIGWVPVVRAAAPGGVTSAFDSPIAIGAVAVLVAGILVVVVSAIIRRRRASRGDRATPGTG